MDLTSSSRLTWGSFLNRFRSIPTSLWHSPAKSCAPCSCSEPWESIVIFCYSYAHEKKGSLGRTTVKSKAVENTRAAEAPDEKRVRLQEDQVRHSLARVAETPEQYQSNIVLNNGWTLTFKVQGQVYHHAGSLHAANAEDSKYLQIYFLGEDEQMQRRQKHCPQTAKNAASA
ncbi:hypothetical protein TNCV_854161 [Trichonephila clavipes]|nr:hypothetical protein TNCV_854161 [Trichonephila clavipes]